MDLENIADLLILALNEKKDFIYSENGLTINVKLGENSSSIYVEYKRNEIEEVIDKFEDFLREIDDELFVDVCEELGNDKVESIQNAVNGDDLKLIKESISEFTYALSKIASNKIREHEEEIKKLIKYVRIDSIDENYSS